MKLVNFVLSKAFKERLKNIQSPITDALLKIKKVDFDSNNYRNFISVSNDDKTMISFVDRNKENKINEILLELDYGHWNLYSLKPGDEVTLKPEAFSHYKGYDDKWYLGYNYIAFPYFNQNRTFKVDYTTYSGVKLKNSLGTFVKTKNAIETPSHIKKIPKSLNKEIWNPNKRIKTKAGKFIRTLFGDKFSDSEITHWVNEYQKQAIAECGENGLFKELEGESIRWAYNEINYFNLKGDLGNSCMRYEKCQKYLDIYCKNTDNVGLLVILEKEKVKARCLLWYPEGKNSNIKWHDRIYFNEYSDKQLMEVYLKINGFEDIYRNKDFKNVSIDLKHVDFEYYPYMDTMKYLDGNTLYSITDTYEKLLQNTNGGYESQSYDCCDRCGSESESLNYIERGRARGDNLCEDCCTYCEDINEYVHSDDSVWSSYDGCHYYEENTVYSNILGDYILRENAIGLYNGDYTHEDEDYITSVEGYNFVEGHRSENEFVEVEGEWYKDDNENIYYNEETQEWDLITNKKEENELVSTD